jgi:hypothetical protein
MVRAMTETRHHHLPPWRLGAALFLGLLAFYAVTMPQNTVEAIDGYDYALAAETIPLANSHDTRSILFHKINRVAYLAAASIKPSVRAYELLRWQSILAAAGAVLLFARLLVVGFDLAPTIAGLGAGFLAVSYGFWRYGSEVELYATSTLNVILDSERRAPDTVLGLVPAGLLGGLTASYYQPNAIPLFLAMPVLLLSTRTLWRFVIYGATGTLVVLTVLCIAYIVREHHAPTISTLLAFINERGEEFPAPHVSLWSFGQASLSVAHDLVSSHWLYGFDSVTQWLAAHLPKRFYRFEETIYAAQHAPALVRTAAVAFAGLCVALIATIAVAARAYLTDDVPRVTHPRLVAFMVAWFCLHAAVTLTLDPSTEEPWIIATTPLIALFTVFCLAPACTRGGQWVACAAWVCLLVVNFAGGVGIYANPAHERRRLNMAYLETHAHVGDVLVASSVEHNDWLHARYRLGLTVLRVSGTEATTWGIDPRANIKGATEGMLRTFAAQGRQIFTLERAFDPGERVKIRDGDAAYQDALTFSAAWRSRAVRVADTLFGAVYKIRPDGQNN